MMFFSNALGRIFDYGFNGKQIRYLKFCGNYGFLNIQMGTTNGKNNTGAATIVLGYSYWIGKS